MTKAEEDSNVVHIEFPQVAPTQAAGEIPEVKLIELDWMGLDTYIRQFLQEQGNELAIRRIDNIENRGLED